LAGLTVPMTAKPRTSVSCGSWSTNEIAVNWNSALSWVASFVADQGNG
jgi:hypothetical protein